MEHEYVFWIAGGLFVASALIAVFRPHAPGEFSYKDDIRGTAAVALPILAVLGLVFVLVKFIQWVASF